MEPSNPSMTNIARYAVCTLDQPVELIRAHYVTHHYVPHAHDEYVIAVIDTGRARLDHAWGAEIIDAGSLVLIPPGVFHEGSPDSVSGCTSSMFYIPAPLMDAAAAGAGLSSPKLDAPIVISDSIIVQRCLALHDLLSLKPRPEASERESFMNLLGTIMRAVRAATGGPRTRRVSSDLEAARAYIDAHFLERLTIAAVSQVARLSPSQFSRAFRKAFGAAPYVYLENKRLQHARSAIAGGEPISSAALTSRFSDQAHLTRRFKRTWGITPGVMARTTYPLREAADRAPSSN